MRVSTENDGGNAGMGKFGMEVIRQVIDFVSQIGPLKHNVKCHRNCVRNASEMRQKCARNDLINNGIMKSQRIRQTSTSINQPQIRKQAVDNPTPLR